MSFRTNAGRGSNGHGVALFATTAGTGATQLVLTTAPGTGGASPYTVSPTPVVTAKSGAGVTDTSFVGVVTCTLNVLSGSPVLSGTTTKTAVAGVADFSANGLTVTGAGTWTLTFSSGSLSPAVSATGTTTSTAATKLTITTQPVGSTSPNLATQPVVAAQNAGGSTDTSYVGTVVPTLNVLTGSATLGGSEAAGKACTAGVCTFTNLTVTAAAGATWTITFTSGTLTSATSSTGTTTGGAANLLQSPNDLSNATYWTPTPSVASAALVAGILKHDGSTGSVSRVTSDTPATASGSGNGAGVEQIITIAGGAAGKTFTISCWARAVTGAGNLSLKCSQGGVLDHFSADLALTTAWQFYTFTVTNDGSTGTGTQNVGFYRGTGTGTGFQWYVDEATVING